MGISKNNASESSNNNTCGPYNCPSDDECCHMVSAGRFQCFNPRTHDCLPGGYLCGKGNLACNNTSASSSPAGFSCYSPTRYVCINGDTLCPISAPLRCGEACYSERHYVCMDGRLVPVAQVTESVILGEDSFVDPVPSEVVVEPSYLPSPSPVDPPTPSRPSDDVVYGAFGSPYTANPSSSIVGWRYLLEDQRYLQFNLVSASSPFTFSIERTSVDQYSGEYIPGEKVLDLFRVRLLLDPGTQIPNFSATMAYKYNLSDLPDIESDVSGVIRGDTTTTPTVSAAWKLKITYTLSTTVARFGVAQDDVDTNNNNSFDSGFVIVSN